MVFPGTKELWLYEGTDLEKEEYIGSVMLLSDDFACDCPCTDPVALSRHEGKVRWQCWFTISAWGKAEGGTSHGFP